MREAARVMKKSGLMLVVVNNERNPIVKYAYTSRRTEISGYVSQLVGFSWLKQMCRSNGLKARVCSANPHYGLLYYFVLPRIQELNFSDRELAAAFGSTSQQDQYGHNPDKFSLIFASHLIVQISHAHK
jgi:hypothetical protein